MRTVMNTAEVMHLWANETQDFARNANDSASFRGDTAFSYLTPIARIVRNAKGERAFLVTNQTYSVTTSGKHMPAVRRAIPRGATVFRVEVVARGGYSAEDFDAERELLRYADRIAAADAKAKRARVNKEWREHSAAELRAEAGMFAQFFGIADSGYSVELVEELRVRAEHARAPRIDAERERNAAAIAEQEALFAEALPKWRSREIHFLPYRAFDTRSDMLRLSEDGSEVETSRGANVPVRHARRLFAAWMAGHNVVDRSVGVYHVSRVEPDGITIGCHYITRDEAMRFAQEQGWPVTGPAAVQGAA